MAMPKSTDPRRFRGVVYLTKAEQEALLKARDMKFPRRTISDALREIVIEWIAGTPVKKIAKKNKRGK